MIKNKYFLFGLLLAVLSGTLGSVGTRLTDDRELFMGVTNVTRIKPNLLILMDNSGSMESAIYHPAYNPKTNYNPGNDNLEDTFTNLDSIFLDFNDDNDTGNRFSNTAAHTLTDIATFKVCRGNIINHWNYNARGTFTSTLSTYPRKWKVYKDSFKTQAGALYTPAANQIIDYKLSGNTIGAKARIIGVSEARDTSGAKKWYWIITVDTGTPGPPPFNGNPSAGSYIYINYRNDPTWDTAVVLKKQNEDSSSYHETIMLKLYGADLYANGSASRYSDSHDQNYHGDGVMYDDNYLFWLFCHATTEQLNQVSAWATGVDQGKFPDANGTLQWAGLHRIGVARETLTNLAADVYTSANLGLARFASSGDSGTTGDGGRVIAKINPTGFNLSDFQATINNVKSNARGTMLAESLADVWAYFKGTYSTTLNYQPNDGTQTLDNDVNLPSDMRMPINPYCRQNYVIVMTDGQSTADNFNDSKYDNSIFRSSVKTWGDQDANDPPGSGTDRDQPTNLTFPDRSPYCPQNTCWIPTTGTTSGSDFLDDVAFLMNDRDMFPNDIYDAIEPDANHPDMPGKQNVKTYVIGLTVNNDMLAQAADDKHGDGQYYTASNATELKDALVSIINNINLRNFAFAAFTAPKRVTRNVGEGSSYVGYFMPDAEASIWEGHLQSFTLTDKWCPDLNKSTTLDEGECDIPWETEYECKKNNVAGTVCLRTLQMAPNPSWDAATKIAESVSARNLFTHDSSDEDSPYTMIPFTYANASTLQPLFGSGATLANAQTIATTINAKKLGDIFHSDIAYVGPPLPGKKFLKNLNPAECTATDKSTDGNCFENFLKVHGIDPDDKKDSGRKKMVYVGSNDGILHQIDATTGAELWGFIPDEVLPSLKKIVVDGDYTFTVDGRLYADDIYYRGTANAWKTILAFGLRDGGNSYYTLDVTTVGSQPVLLWKFKDDVYSGKSWGKPIIGKIKYWNGTANIDKWVVVVTGGFAFNNENPDDLQGKAVFVIDASSGALIWMIGYHPDGAADDGDTAEIDTTASGVKFLTAKPEFNYAVPSALSVIDRDGNGYLDTIYFGNVAGHVFKTNIAAGDPGDWKTYLLFNHPLTYGATNRISAVNGGVVTVDDIAGFAENQNVIGKNSHAMGIISFIDVANKKLSIAPTPNEGGLQFQGAEEIAVPQYDPLFLSPAIALDPCSNLWVAFGTGDRIRSRTNPASGKFVAFRDGRTTVGDEKMQKTNIQTSDLVALTWTGDPPALAATNTKVTDKWGWYFNYPYAANYEKLFDPEPIILPDRYLIPHIYFNTYQPPASTGGGSSDCNAPEEATMKFYDLTLNYCGGGTVTGAQEIGRIAGGGMFVDYIVFEGTGALGSVPPLQELISLKLSYTGGLLFWKEKKR